MSEDALKLLEALERKFGKRVQFYQGQAYFDCQRLDLIKIEADYHKWKAERAVQP